jgi:sortase A
MYSDRLTYPDIARILGTGLISTGVGLLLFVMITVFWGDPFTHFSEARAQNALEKQLSASLSVDESALQTQSTLDPMVTRAAERRLRRKLNEADAVGRLRIEKIGLSKIIVKDATPAALDEGPGFYHETGFSGTGLPVAIAGHRTTHGAPFLNIDKLKPGDRIVIDLPYARFVYIVTRTKIITPRDWSIIDVGAWSTDPKARRRMKATNVCPGGSCEHLVMTACHPKYSAKQRIAVFSRLDQVSLRKGTA